MSFYKYEMHSHTSEVSRCSHISATELVRRYYDIGFTGLCVTDHFYGNHYSSDGIPWKDRVRDFCFGYDIARSEGERLGIDVFFALEYTVTPGTDFLIYGISEEWLSENQDSCRSTFKEFSSSVRASGGFIVQAHPFREGTYIPMISLAPGDIDGAEVFNACRLESENERADWYAESFDLIRLSGSDIHSAEQSVLGCMLTERKAKDLKDLIRMIRMRKARTCMIHASSPDILTDI
ncbi:MAG: histidinol phosphatase [Eubacteriales bacterium]|nr:histidinol phosphatase [Eubacteriales bacterium]MDD4716850.1 histidinol phosphatase [Eubacteriales bacterium]